MYYTVRVQFHSCHADTKFSWNYFFEDIIFSPLCALGPFVEDQLTIYMVHFCSLYSVSLVCISGFVTLFFDLVKPQRSWGLIIYSSLFLELNQYFPYLLSNYANFFCSKKLFIKKLKYPLPTNYSWKLFCIKYDFCNITIESCHNYIYLFTYL